MMNAKLFLLILAIAIHKAASSECNACNCQFNNVEILDGLIDAKISTALESGTGILYESQACIDLHTDKKIIIRILIAILSVLAKIG